MIQTAKALWTRTQEIARENVPEPFLRYPYADELRLGWYPSKLVFQEGCEESLYKALPDVTGAVFPYHHDFGTLSHLIIAPYDAHGQPDPRKRALLPAMPKKNRRQAGIFGVHRLKGQKPCVLITDDEVLVCQQPDTIAIGHLSSHVATLIRRSTRVAQLKSANQGWISRMLGLAKAGIQVLVGDEPLVEHLVGVISGLFAEDLGLAVINHRVTELLEHAAPLERMAVLQTLKQRHNLDLSQTLPDDFHVYRREGDFYEAVEERLREKIAGAVFVHPQGLQLHLRDSGTMYAPMEPSGLGAVICEIMEARLDLVDFAYNTLKELPHFYLYQGKDQLDTRAQVSDKIAAVVMAVLCRMAAGRDI